jgi:Tetracyclin repressor-like, C-terminal domain
MTTIEPHEQPPAGGERPLSGGRLDLAVDAYARLRRAMEAAAAEAGRDPRQRLRAVCRAYRSWAKANPAAYQLAFGAELATDLDPDDPVSVAARAAKLPAMIPVAAMLHQPAPPPGGSRAELERWWAVVDDRLPVLAVRIWTRVHGFVSLEIAGHFRWSPSEERPGLRPAFDEVFELELDSLVLMVEEAAARL